VRSSPGPHTRARPGRGGQGGLFPESTRKEEGGEPSGGTVREREATEQGGAAKAGPSHRVLPDGVPQRSSPPA